MAERANKPNAAATDWQERERGYAEVQSAARQRRDRWDNLSESIHRYGAWVVSLPGARRMRVEAAENSDLPEKLRALGYDIIYCGAGVRLTGIEGRDGHMNVQIFEFNLPR